MIMLLFHWDFNKKSVYLLSISKHFVSDLNNPVA